MKTNNLNGQRGNFKNLKFKFWGKFTNMRKLEVSLKF